jgi:hypothetical protein
MSGVEFTALRHVSPAVLLKYFSIVSSGVKTDEPTGEEYLEVVFEEKNELSEGFSRDAYENKGIFSKRVQDFSLRGRAVFLALRRRRWRHKVTGEQITRDFTFLAKGVAFTAELADFLKQGGR